MFRKLKSVAQRLPNKSREEKLRWVPALCAECCPFTFADVKRRMYDLQFAQSLQGQCVLIVRPAKTIYVDRMPV